MIFKEVFVLRRNVYRHRVSIKGEESMKRYTKDNVNVPMNFYKIYTYVLIPIISLIFAIGIFAMAIMGKSLKEDVFELIITNMIYVIMGLTPIIVAWNGLRRMQSWGYVFNQVLIVFRIIGSLVIMLVANNIAVVMLLIIYIAILVLIFLYFLKRKALFGVENKNM